MDSFAARSEHSFVAMAEQGSQQHRRRRSTQIPISPQYAQFPPHTKSASRFSMALSTPMKVSLSDDEVSGLYIPQWRTTGPRTHYIRRHICALTGWLVAFSLLFTLFYSVPTLPQSTLSKLQSLRRSQLAAAPAPVIQGTTIVSAFFAVQDGKKHRLDEYWTWLEYFLSNVEAPVVFYTSPDLLEHMQQLRGDKPATFITDYAQAEEMPPIEALGGKAWSEQMNKIDPENFKHVAGVYAPWTAKPWMVQHAKDLNLYSSTYFFWVDAGGFRERDYPHHFRSITSQLDKVFATVPDDTLVLGDANVPWPEGTEYVRAATNTGDMDRADCHIQGGWFGGKAAGIDWWERETWRITALQAGLQRFAGKEQDTWTHTARLNWPKIYVQNMSLNNLVCGPDLWFAAWFWSDSDECQIPVWNGPELFKQEQAALTAQANDTIVRT